MTKPFIETVNERIHTDADCALNLFMSLGIGTRVEFTATLKRRVNYSTGEYGAQKYWHRNECAPAKGLVVGIRVLSNGKRTWIGSEEGFEYTPTEHFRAVLVAYAMNRKPVLVPLESVVPLVANMAVRVFFSEADEGYIATFYGNSFISGFGDTPMEAFEQLQVAAEIMN